MSDATRLQFQRDSAKFDKMLKWGLIGGAALLLLGGGFAGYKAGGSGETKISPTPEMKKFLEEELGRRLEASEDRGDMRAVIVVMAIFLMINRKAVVDFAKKVTS